MAAKKKRTKKQIAATKKLVALNRKRARMKNPKKKTRRKARPKVKVGARSRVTGKRPDAELKRRRKRNTKKGYYPNPIAGYRVVLEKTSGNRLYFNGFDMAAGATNAARFSTKPHAVKVARKIADRLGLSVGVEKIASRK